MFTSRLESTLETNWKNESPSHFLSSCVTCNENFFFFKTKSLNELFFKCRNKIAILHVQDINVLFHAWVYILLLNHK